MSSFRLLPVCRALAALGMLVSGPAFAVAQSAPAPPAQLSVDSVQGNVVSLSWAAPAAPPEGYVIEGGFAPGDVAGSLALGSGATAAQVTLPQGVYFIRVVAVTHGARSTPSNEVRTNVGVAEPPSTPEQFKGLAVGRGVTLSWRQTFAGGTPSQALLDVEGPITGTFAIAPSGSFRVEGAPDGVYTLRLRAGNADGASAATAPVTLTVPGLVARVEHGPALPAGEWGLPVRFERFDAPRIEQLAAREGLAAVVSGAATEFEAVGKLREWVAAQFPFGEPNPYPPWDALIILDAIRAGITGGFCGQYAQVMVQALAAFGMPARYIEVGKTDNPYAHFTLEVWFNTLNKWVVVDPSFNIHYEKNGVPLSAIEVRDALLSGTAGAVDVVEGAHRAGRPSPAEYPLQTKEQYHYLRYFLKVDHVSVPQEAPFDRWGDMIEFDDGRTTPWELTPGPSPFPKEKLTARSTSDPAVANAPLNQIWVTPRSSTGTEVLFDLAHNMPQMVAAEFRVIDSAGQPGPWQPHGSATLAWSVDPNDRAIEVRGVNLRGIRGPATRVALVAP